MKSDVDFLMRVADRLESLGKEEGRGYIVLVDEKWPNRLRRIARGMDEPRQAEMQRAAESCKKQKATVLACIENINRSNANLYGPDLLKQKKVYDIMHITNCPVCTKPMRFQVSSRNGHVKVSCEGPCPDWIE